MAATNGRIGGFFSKTKKRAYNVGESLSSIEMLYTGTRTGQWKPFEAVQCTMYIFVKQLLLLQKLLFL